VQKGFIAMRDVETAKLNLDLAEARLATARENLARLEAQQSAELAKADESVRSARASLDRARVNAVQDDIKKRQYEQALASMRAAEVALRDADALAFSRNQAQAQVRQLRSVAENSRVLLGETRVRAPFSGVVTRIFVEVGELITALSSFSAGTPILRIEDRSKMRVLMQINEIDVARLRVGTPAEIQVDALPDEIILGEVVRIASTKTEPAQGAASPVVRFEVEVEFAEVPDGVMSGMTAKCTMRVVELRNIVRIPLDYVGRDGDKTFVKIVREGAEEPERREVVLGPSSGAFVQVRTGLNAGERITRPEFDGPARQGLIQFGS
jgi:HlyD family secretion protein